MYSSIHSSYIHLWRECPSNPAKPSNLYARSTSMHQPIPTPSNTATTYSTLLRSHYSNDSAMAYTKAPPNLVRAQKRLQGLSWPSIHFTQAPCQLSHGISPCPIEVHPMGTIALIGIGIPSRKSAPIFRATRHTLSQPYM
jgi:hypothetical protein